MVLWRRMQVQDFDLALTLASGQFFRYYEEDHHYLLLTSGKALRVKQDGGTFFYQGADEAFVRRIFGLDDAYVSQIEMLKQDIVLAPMLNAYPGLRVMRQDLHETAIGFICSSQSNIPKIRMNLHLLAHTCGDVVDGHAQLPRPGLELDHAVVRNAKTGYRATFIVRTNSMLTPELLQQISSADYAQSHALLCALPGIGPKIADCICLFALGHGEAFPVDVHIMRIMQRLFPRSRLDREEKIKRFAQKRWGKNAGLAQQFLFQWARDTQSRVVQR